MASRTHSCASYSRFALVLAAGLSGPSLARAAGPEPPGAAVAAGEDAQAPLDPGAVKAGDKVRLVLKEIHQRSGAVVLTAVKSVYGTVRSVTRLEVDGKENIVFELVPFGSDGKTVLKYDKETGQTFRVEPTVKFGTFQVERILPMPSDEEMAKMAAFRGGGGDDASAKDLVAAEDREATVRRVQSLRSEVRALRMAVADQEAVAANPGKPPVLMMRDRGGASRVDSGSDTAAQEVAAARKGAAEAAIIRLKFRLSEKERVLHEETQKLSDYGVAGFGVDDLAELPPAERKIVLSSRVKVLDGDIRRLKLAIVEQEASSKEITKAPVPMLRDRGGTARVDSGLDTSAQEVVVARRKAVEASIIRLKARLLEKEEELRLVKAELAKMEA